MDYLNSWKDSVEVFQKQLDLNIKELNSNYPAHWLIDLDFLKSIKFENIAELCCGVGSFYELLRQNFNIKNYIGYDYSENAVNIAKKTWNYNNFFVKNIYDIQNDDIKDCDVLYLSGVFDIIPDDSLLDKILSFNIKYVILSRFYTDKSTHCHTYKAYNIIDTYKFTLDESIFHRYLEKNNYKIIKSKEKNFLLELNK